MGGRPGVRAMAWKAMKAHSSSTTALCTALWGSVPQAKGPWLCTSTAGTWAGSIFRDWKVSMITLPVSSSYLPAISSGVIFRVQGISP